MRVKMFKGSVNEVTRRKSARISALEEEKKKKACTSENDSVSENQTHVTRGTSTSRRGRKRKKLEDVGLSSPQNSEDPKDEDYSIYDDEAAYLSYIQEDPETRVLEFILDILQRRDICNLFAKPVNPQEVWTYYKIIKEPMDFGTMRAKLQERKYTSLEQFEYDVNLISTNAMHFNASTTVFYQEARAIQELAQQLFRSLRADPEQFQLQSLLTKRGPGRKPQYQDRDSHTQVPRPIGRPSSSRRLYVRRNSQAGLSNANSSGMRNGGNSNSLETERRQTYRLSDKDKSLLSVVLDSAKILGYNGNGESGYKESLMRFAKNLGPTAQRIAESKLAQPFSQPTSWQRQATPPIAHAIPVLALPAPEAPSHLFYGNNGQMHRTSPYYLPSSDSNASIFHGDASAQGHARNYNVSKHINDSANRRNMNPPSTSQLGMVPNYRDKGKMVVDLNQNSGLVGTRDAEARSYPENLNSNVRLESHIRVVRDYSSPGTSSSGMKFRALDMLGKPNPLENQQQFQPAHQLPSSATLDSGILSWAVNTLANTSHQENQQLQPAQLSSTGSSNQSSLQDIMAGRSTYLKPSSSLLRSSALLSNLSEAPTSRQDFGSQLNNNNAAKSTETGQQLQCSQRSAEQDLQGSCSFLNMLGDDTQWERSTLLRQEQHLDDGNYSLGSNTFMRNEQQLGEVNCQLGNTTSMRKDQLCGESTTQWGYSTFQSKEQHLADGNFQLENNIFFRQDQQLNGGNFLLGNGTFLRKEQQVDAESFHLGNSTWLWKEKQLQEGNFRLGDSTCMRKDQLGEGNLTNFQFGNSTFLRTEQQFDQGSFLLGKTSFMSEEPQLDHGMFMSKEQVLNEASFKQGNSAVMSNGQQLDEGPFQLGKSTCMRPEKQIGEVNPQWWDNSFTNKDQQLCYSNNQSRTSTFLRNDQQPLGRSEQQQPVDQGVMPDWYSAICSNNERATTSSSTQWYQKEPIDQSLVSLFLVDNQQPNLALQL
uniref:transcription initiation factor TFIID subunit 1-like n=1 Tax=Fragaria vesca subsp. vesca TaxID=101020 RepID=UPI0005CB3C0C|nr:PREDICTED: transcription initiation factor TFIID subunit 1-like [Fragaria vesca subsp. vesca]